MIKTQELFKTKRSRGAWIVIFVCILISLAAFVTASQVQRDFGRVEVSNGIFLNATLVTWMFVSSQVIAPIPV